MQEKCQCQSEFQLIFVNFTLKIFFSEDCFNLSTGMMLELNLYDTVELKTINSFGAYNSMMNSFEGRLLP